MSTNPPSDPGSSPERDSGPLETGSTPRETARSPVREFIQWFARRTRVWMVILVLAGIGVVASAITDWVSIHFLTGITAKVSWVDDEGTSADYTASVVNHLGHTATISCEVWAIPLRDMFTIPNLPDGAKQERRGAMAYPGHIGPYSVTTSPDIECHEA
jgi:hypothetical protein